MVDPVSLAVTLVAGQAFTRLSASVTRALKRKAAFRDILRDVNYTLISLTRQARLIQEIHEYNLELDLSNDEIQNLITQMDLGRELVDRLSGLKFRLCYFCCSNDCTIQLQDLNRSLDSLFETLYFQQIRDIKENLLLSRQQDDKSDKMLGILMLIQEKIDNSEVKDLMKKLVEREARGSIEASTSQSNTEYEGKGKLVEHNAGNSIETSTLQYNTENEGNGKAQVASLEVASLEVLVEAAFQRLFDAVVQEKDRTVMFRPFSRLKSTLDFLKPFIDEISQHNKALDRPREELESFRKQVIKGVDLVSECSKVHRLTSTNKKYKYTDLLFELDESLQWQLGILLGLLARDVRENSSLIRNIQDVVKKIDSSGILHNQLEFEDLCDTAKPPIVTAELEPMNLQGIKGEMKETFSAVNMNKGVRIIEGGNEILKVSEPQPPTVVLNKPGTLAVGALGGFLFSVLYEALKELAIKNYMFKPLVQSVQSTLESLEKVIQEIIQLNDDLDRLEKEMAGLKTQLEEGIVLIDRCCKVRRWTLPKKYKFYNKLNGWNESLKEQLEVLKVFAARDGKETLKTVRQIQSEVADLEIVTKQTEAKVQAAMKQPQIDAEIEAWGAVPELPTLTVGLDKPVDELKMLMFNDEVSMVVLTAPGGCGKTTLATKFCRDKEVREKFKNNIFFVTVPKTPHFCLIVQELYKRKGNQLIPPFKDDENALKWLKTFVKEQGQDPLLVVLDDVWSGSESFVLHKFAFEMRNHKVLVTSRSEFPGFGSPYRLQPLDFPTAMALFHLEASLGDRSNSHIPLDISKQVVEGCKGSPLAITVAAKSLRAQAIEVWEKRLDELSKGSPILDSETDLLLRLRISIESSDVSNKEMIMVKKCFLDLGSFPENKRIPVAALIDIWTEFYELDEDFLCVANLHQIINRGLANLVVTRKDKLQGDGYYTEHFVTQHDLLRELAIYETKLDDTEQRERLIINISGNNFPQWWREQEYQRMKARLLSISTDGTFSTNWPDMELPEAEVLVLNFQTKNYALPPFVEKMAEMKVLVLTNYGIVPSELTNFQFLCTSSNLKRMRLECISIPSIAKHPIQFSSLQKISLFMCNIGQAFTNGSIQLSHAWPNLVELNIEYCNDLEALPADIGDLIHLKKLSITNSHKLLALPEDIGNLAKLELLRLRSCTGLEKLPDSTGNLKKLNFLDISYCFSIKELPENFGELSSLRKLNMTDCSRLTELPLSVSNLEHLEVIGDDDTESLWQPFFPIEGTYIVLAEKKST